MAEAKLAMSMTKVISMAMAEFVGGLHVDKVSGLHVRKAELSLVFMLTRLAVVMLIGGRLCWSRRSSMMQNKQMLFWIVNISLTLMSLSTMMAVKAEVMLLTKKGSKMVMMMKAVIT